MINNYLSKLNTEWIKLILMYLAKLNNSRTISVELFRIIHHSRLNYSECPRSQVRQMFSSVVSKLCFMKHNRIFDNISQNYQIFFLLHERITVLIRYYNPIFHHFKISPSTYKYKNKSYHLECKSNENKFVLHTSKYQFP